MLLPDIRDVQRLEGKRVLLRTDFNIPLIQGVVSNDFRIRKALETILFLKGKNTKVILISHRSGSGESLLPVYSRLKEYIGATFVESLERDVLRSIAEQMQAGDIFLLENIRFDKREKENDSAFAGFLASLGDIYVNDAFSASHRKHASIVGIPRYVPHYAGILFQREVEKLSEALQPKSPSLCILGGAKFETKEPLIRKLLQRYDRIFIGGALAHDFFKARGLNVGKSLISKHAHVSDLLNNEKIILPKDVTVSRGGGTIAVDVNAVSDNDIIVDQGPKTISQIRELVSGVKFILWNGPLGNYENGFSAQTEALAKMVAESGAETIVGGGDTVASIAHLGLEDEFSFVSTGGGAMIDFLSDGTLFGIEALEV